MLVIAVDYIFQWEMSMELWVALLLVCTEITRQVKEAARLMRITVLDHLILTDAGYYSFADEGEL